MEAALHTLPASHFSFNPPSVNLPPPVKRFWELHKRNDEYEATEATLQNFIRAWGIVPTNVEDVSGLLSEIEDGTVNLDDPNCFDGS